MTLPKLHFLRKALRRYWWLAFWRRLRPADARLLHDIGVYGRGDTKRYWIE